MSSQSFGPRSYNGIPMPSGSFVHMTAVIGPNVLIGENVYIGPHCIIGYPAEWKGHEHEDKGVWIGSGTRITGMVTIDSGVEKPTNIGESCYIMKHAHVGHDAQVCNDVTISCGAKIGGHAIIQDDCNIGLNAVIHQRQNIAYGCMIGMGTVVTKNTVTSPFDVFVGNPARWIKKNEKHPKYPGARSWADRAPYTVNTEIKDSKNII